PLFGELPADSQTYWDWARIVVANGWVGRNPFFLGPLYPYLLALLRLHPDSTPIVPLALQCVFGSLTVVAIAASARVVCGPRQARIAGGLAAGYAMATFMDLSILAESVLWLLESVFLFLQLQVTQEPRRPRSVISGVLVGLMALARPSFFLL